MKESTRRRLEATQRILSNGKIRLSVSALQIMGTIAAAYFDLWIAASIGLVLSALDLRATLEEFRSSARSRSSQ